MPVVPLGRQAYERQAGFTPEVRLVNLYLEKDESGSSPDDLMRIQRPGLVQSTTFDSPIKGLFQQDGVFNGDMFVNTGALLYRAGASAGAIPAPGRVAYAAGVGVLAIVAGTSLYAYTPSVVPVAIPVGSAQDTDQLKGYIIVATPSGRFYWMEPGATVIDPLNFATAESSQDGLVASRRLGDEIWMFGTRSIEPWQTTGDQDAPFAPAAGRQFDRGCMARDSVQRFDNSLVWVGENGVVYKASSVPERISTHGIEERIRQRTGLPSAWVYGMADGHLFYILRIPGQGSFAFDAATQTWSEWATEGVTEWTAIVGVDTPNGTFAGDASSTTLWQLSPGVSADGDRIMRRTVTGTIPLSGKPPRLDTLTVGMGSDADCTILVRWRDAQDAFPDYWEELDARAPADLVNLYRLGAGIPPYRTFEIEVTDPVVLRISGAMANEAWA